MLEINQNNNATDSISVELCNHTCVNIPVSIELKKVYLSYSTDIIQEFLKSKEFFDINFNHQALNLKRSDESKSESECVRDTESNSDIIDHHISSSNLVKEDHFLIERPCNYISKISGKKIKSRFKIQRNVHCNGNNEDLTELHSRGLQTGYLSVGYHSLLNATSSTAQTHENYAEWKSDTSSSSHTHGNIAPLNNTTSSSSHGHGNNVPLNNTTPSSARTRENNYLLKNTTAPNTNICRAGLRRSKSYTLDSPKSICLKSLLSDKYGEQHVRSHCKCHSYANHVVNNRINYLTPFEQYVLNNDTNEIVISPVNKYKTDERNSTAHMLPSIVTQKENIINAPLVNTICVDTNQYLDKMVCTRTILLKNYKSKFVGSDCSTLSSNAEALAIDSSIAQGKHTPAFPYDKMANPTPMQLKCLNTVRNDIFTKSKAVEQIYESNVDTVRNVNLKNISNSRYLRSSSSDHFTYKLTNAKYNVSRSLSENQLNRDFHDPKKCSLMLHNRTNTHNANPYKSSIPITKSFPNSHNMKISISNESSNAQTHSSISTLKLDHYNPTLCNLSVPSSVTDSRISFCMLDENSLSKPLLSVSLKSNYSNNNHHLSIRRSLSFSIHDNKKYRYLKYTLYPPYEINKPVQCDELQCSFLENRSNTLVNNCIEAKRFPIAMKEDKCISIEVPSRFTAKNIYFQDFCSWPSPNTNLYSDESLTCVASSNVYDDNSDSRISNVNTENQKLFNSSTAHTNLDLDVTTFSFQNTDLELKQSPRLDMIDSRNKIDDVSLMSNFLNKNKVQNHPLRHTYDQTFPQNVTIQQSISSLESNNSNYSYVQSLLRIPENTTPLSYSSNTLIKPSIPNSHAETIDLLINSQNDICSSLNTQQLLHKRSMYNLVNNSNTEMPNDRNIIAQLKSSSKSYNENCKNSHTTDRDTLTTHTLCMSPFVDSPLQSKLNTQLAHNAHLTQSVPLVINSNEYQSQSVNEATHIHDKDVVLTNNPLTMLNQNINKNECSSFTPNSISNPDCTFESLNLPLKCQHHTTYNTSSFRKDECFDQVYSYDSPNINNNPDAMKCVQLKKMHRIKHPKNTNVCSDIMGNHIPIEIIPFRALLFLYVNGNTLCEPVYSEVGYLKIYSNASKTQFGYNNYTNVRHTSKHKNHKKKKFRYDCPKTPLCIVFNSTIKFSYNISDLTFASLIKIQLYCIDTSKKIAEVMISLFALNGVLRNGEYIIPFDNQHQQSIQFKNSLTNNHNPQNSSNYKKLFSYAQKNKNNYDSIYKNHDSIIKELLKLPFSSSSIENYFPDQSSLDGRFKLSQHSHIHSSKKNQNNGCQRYSVQEKNWIKKILKYKRKRKYTSIFCLVECPITSPMSTKCCLKHLRLLRNNQKLNVKSNKLFLNLANIIYLSHHSNFDINEKKLRYWAQYLRETMMTFKTRDILRRQRCDCDKHYPRKILENRLNLLFKQKLACCLLEYGFITISFPKSDIPIVYQCNYFECSKNKKLNSNYLFNSDCKQNNNLIRNDNSIPPKEIIEMHLANKLEDVGLDYLFNSNVYCNKSPKFSELQMNLNENRDGFPQECCELFASSWCNVTLNERLQNFQTILNKSVNLNSKECISQDNSGSFSWNDYIASGQNYSYYSLIDNTDSTYSLSKINSGSMDRDYNRDDSYLASSRYQSEESDSDTIFTDNELLKSISSNVDGEMTPQSETNVYPLNNIITDHNNILESLYYMQSELLSGKTTNTIYQTPFSLMESVHASKNNNLYDHFVEMIGNKSDLSEFFEKKKNLALSIASVPFTKNISDKIKKLLWVHRNILKYRGVGLLKLSMCLDPSCFTFPVTEDCAEFLKLLDQWPTLNCFSILELISPFSKIEQVRQCATKNINVFTGNQLTIILPQIIQAIQYENPCPEKNNLLNCLGQRAIKSPMIAVKVFWGLSSEMNLSDINDDYFQYYKYFIQCLNKSNNQYSTDITWSILQNQVKLINYLRKIAYEIRIMRDKTDKRSQLLKELFLKDESYFADKGNKSKSHNAPHYVNVQKFDPPIPLPISPHFLSIGISIDDCLVMRSSQHPLLLAFKVLVPPSYFSDSYNSMGSSYISNLDISSIKSSHTTNNNNNNNEILYSARGNNGRCDDSIESLNWDKSEEELRKLGYRECQKKYLFKAGEDLRQDQLVTQLINYCNILLKDYGCDFDIVQYQVLALSRTDGLIEFIDNSEPISNIKRKHGTIMQFFTFVSLKQHPHSNLQTIVNRYIRSCAALCVITYILGVGDRHLDNLLITEKGNFFHVDFGYIFGEDPKPFPPPMKLCREMIEALGGLKSKHYTEFQLKCCECFRCLRRHSKIIVDILLTMSGSKMSAMKLDPMGIIHKVYEKLNPQEIEAVAESTLLGIIQSSANALFPAVVDKIHEWTVYLK